MEVLERGRCSQREEKEGLLLVSDREQVKLAVRFQVLRSEDCDSAKIYYFP